MIQSLNDSMIQCSIASPGSLLFLAGIVAAASADEKFLVGLRMGVHVNGSVSADSLRRTRSVGDGVLVANIVSNRAADFIYLVEGWREKCFSAGALGYQFERAPGAAGPLFAK